jgi:hypothetical protein
MIGLEVLINGKKVALLGSESAEEFGVSVTAYPNLPDETASLEMSGYAPSDQTYPDELKWGRHELHLDDEVVIRFVSTPAPDIPARSRYTQGYIGESTQGVMICSNCGRSHLEIQWMIQAERITLCGECAQKIVEFVSDSA